MALINLLPWRQEQREELKKQFFFFLGGAAVMALAVVGYVHMHYQSLIDDQLASNAYLKKEIRILDKRIKKIKSIRSEKERLLARMDVIQQLQRDRPNVVRLFDDLVRVVPGGVNYVKISRSGRELSVEGVAESNTRVSKLMRNMKSSKALGTPRLSVIREEDKNQAGKVFNLKVKETHK